MKNLPGISAAVLSLLAMAGTSQAQIITWGTAQNMVGNTDVLANGTAFDALTFHSSSVTVNGVLFNSASTTAPVSSDSHISVVNTGNSSPGAYGSAFTTASPSSPAYSEATDTIAFNYYGNGTITLSGLTNNDSYQIEVWSQYNNAPGADATTFTGPGGSNSVTLTPEDDQYAIGTFTASGTSEAFNYNFDTTTGGYSIVNAISVRDITVATPEPSSAWLVLAGFAGLGVYLRRKRSSQA